MKNRESAGGPQPLSPSETWRGPRGASLVWLGHSLAKAIRRVQIPRTALSIEPIAIPLTRRHRLGEAVQSTVRPWSMPSSRRQGRICGAAARSPESTPRGQGDAIVAQCFFLDAGNEKGTDAFIAGASPSAAEGMGFL